VGSQRRSADAIGCFTGTMIQQAVPQVPQSTEREVLRMGMHGIGRGVMSWQAAEVSKITIKTCKNRKTSNAGEINPYFQQQKA